MDTKTKSSVLSIIGIALSAGGVIISAASARVNKQLQYETTATLVDNAITKDVVSLVDRAVDMKFNSLDFSQVDVTEAN